MGTDIVVVILFSKMKEEVDAAIEKHGQENPPPASQIFTIKNEPGDGNIHLVQKVFKGAFEVDNLKNNSYGT